jgi:hypothetical protein
LPRQVSSEGKDGEREKNGGNPLPLKGGFAGAAPCEDRGTTLLCYHNQFRQRRATVTTVKTAQKNTLGKAHTPNMLGLWPLFWQINIGENPNRVKLMKKPPGL